MKIAVIGGAGKVGSLVVEEAQKRGLDVTAIVRNSKKLKNDKVKFIEKDLFDLTYDDIKDFDAIVDALGIWDPAKLELHSTTLSYLADLLSNKPNRLLVVGGAASLYVDTEHKVQLIDTAEFPDAYKPVASNMKKAFDMLRKRNDVKWTYLSPSANFVADGIRTGEYQLGGEELLVNSKGESEISYADYAIAMVDEIENAKFINKRFTASSK